MTRLHRVLRIAALLIAVLPGTVTAHGNQPPYIAFWGPFTPEAARCQRQLGMSTERCVETVLHNEMRCAAPDQPVDCSDSARQLARQAAVNRATAAVVATCSSSEVQALLFLDLSEAQTDLSLACNVEPLRMSARMVAADTPTLTPQCRQAMAVTGHSFARTALRAKRAALNRIALHQLQPSQRLARINDSRQKLSKVRALLANRLRHACPGFEAAIGSSAEAWLVDLELQTDCVIFAGYIQSAFTCPR